MGAMSGGRFSCASWMAWQPESSQPAVPVASTEFAEAARDYPLVFVGEEGGSFNVAALVGLLAWSYGTADTLFLHTAQLSGVELFDAQGNLIGINTAIIQGASGIGFAIPADRAQRVVDDLLRRDVNDHQSSEIRPFD